MRALTNARVLLEHGFAEDLAVIVEGRRIVQVVAGAQIAGIATQDLGGGWLMPGFFDTQVNGGGGVLFNAAPDAEALCTIARAHRRSGSTSLLPTVITDHWRVVETAMGAVRSARAVGVPGIEGIHLEGPFLNPVRRGVHRAERMCAMTDEHVRVITAQVAHGAVLLTLAPERFSLPQLRALADAGVTLSVGHTDATFEEMRGAFASGVRAVTHLFNAMSPFHHRAPGAVGAALLSDAYCGIIADGLHVADGALLLALRCLTPSRLMLVTDAMPPVGTGLATFDLLGERIHVQDGGCRDAKGQLAGSCLDMASAVRFCVQRLGLSLADAARMASTTPAACLRLGDTLGRIAPGYRANLVWMDEALHVRGTWIDGCFEEAG
jgi:N-acetylglucosamine-6-phosphate deacetylase